MSSLWSPVGHVSSRSGEACLWNAISDYFTYLPVYRFADSELAVLADGADNEEAEEPAMNDAFGQ